MKKLIILAIAAAMLAACGEGPTKGKHEVKKLLLQGNEKAIVEAQNGYSLKLVQEIAKNDHNNIFVSPLSASFVCSMIANGANGETQQQILDALGVGDFSMSELNAYYLKMMECLPYQDETSKMNIANAMWVSEGYPIIEDFANTVRDHYLATVDNLDLSDPASADVINAWAAKQTDGMIKKICDGNYFSEDLELVVANALCFKGKWHEQFKKVNTRDDVFHAPGGDIETPMMHGKLEVSTSGNNRYVYNEETGEMEEGEPLHARMMRMDYKDHGYSMYVIMPDEDQVFDEWLASFDLETFQLLKEYSISGESEVAFPKFKLENRYRLNEYMQALGMKDVFTNAADLSGISTASGLWLALLQQDTYIEVDEEGTKAAAVTSGWITDSAVMPGEPFICDRPFLFLISTNWMTDVIIFAGVVKRP